MKTSKMPAAGARLYRAKQEAEGLAGKPVDYKESVIRKLAHRVVREDYGYDTHVERTFIKDCLWRAVAAAESAANTHAN